MNAPAEPLKVTIDDDTETVRVDPVTGNVEQDQPDGGVVVQFGAAKAAAALQGGWFDNLIEKIDSHKLGLIANDLHDAISADDRSRAAYLDNKARGIDLLGIELKEPGSGPSSSNNAIDGLSTVTNPLMLEAVLKSWANAQAELLPSSGPVKIENNGADTSPEDQIAEELQRDFNHYLTDIATEYYPDTSHMLLWGTCLGGSGIKKIYRCPMRRRPVSESVDTKNFIVSDTTKDLRSCARITHEIEMRPSVFKRMVMLGAYKSDAVMPQPTTSPNVVDQKIGEVQGTQVERTRPEDQPYTLWECQCELDLPEFATGDFKTAGIPLPYLVTIDKDTKEILSVRRDWAEDDEDCQRLKLYIK